MESMYWQWQRCIAHGFEASFGPVKIDLQCVTIISCQHELEELVSNLLLLHLWPNNSLCAEQLEYFTIYLCYSKHYSLRASHQWCEHEPWAFYKIQERHHSNKTYHFPPLFNDNETIWFLTFSRSHLSAIARPCSRFKHVPVFFLCWTA